MSAAGEALRRGRVGRVLAGPAARWQRVRAPQIVLLGAATAVLPLTIDLYLPALPTLGSDLGAGPAALQLSLTATVVGVALGQLLVGPVSDRLGRRVPLLAGFAGYVVASLACAAATGLPALVAGRFAQGLFGAAGIAVTLAVLRDHESGPALTRAVARLLLVRGAMPLVAPVLGSLLLEVTGWRGLFVALAVFGGAVAGVLLLALPESLPPAERQPVTARSLARAYAALLRDRSFLPPALVSAFGFTAMFAWISGSSFVLQGRYRLSEVAYSLVFALTAACVIGSAQVAPRLADRVGTRRLLRLAPVAGLAAAAALAVLAATGRAPLPAVVALVMVAFVAVGTILTLGAAVALSGQPPHRAGQASGLIGVAQFSLGGAVAPLVGVLGTGTATAMAAVMASCFAAAALAGAVSRPGAPAGPPQGPPPGPASSAVTGSPA